jgi:acyl-CoA synthetase (AMP-forming)/AMP-acid ligase II
VTVLSQIRARARQRPAHPALQEATHGTLRTLSYAELVQRFEAGAARLRASGVAPGDRCGLLARQGTGFVVEALSILEAGGCLVPIPSDCDEAALARFAESARLHQLIRESERFAPRPVAHPVPMDPSEDAAFRALEPAYLRFTSGTTSERKGVILSHARIAERLEAANAGLGVGPDDRIVWLLPMAHHFVVSLLLYLRFGASVLLPESSLARPVLELATRARATFLYASPFHYQLLSKDASPLGLESVRLAVSTAEALRSEVAARFRERFGLALAQALGIIEVGLPVLNLDDAESRPTALGRPLPAYDVWLRDEAGKPVLGPGSPDRSGEICIRGPGLFDAYLVPWTPSVAIVEPDGFRTGDQGFFDAQGVLHLAGRRHNRINMAGMKFFCEEVEAVLARHPDVRECQVRAREHAHLGEIPVAEIVVRDPSAPPRQRDLIAHCRRELPAYKVPREFRTVGALPRTATGKLQR